MPIELCSARAIDSSVTMNRESLILSDTIANRERTSIFIMCDGQEDAVMPMTDFIRGHLRGGSVKLIWWN